MTTINPSLASYGLVLEHIHNFHYAHLLLSPSHFQL